MKTLRILFIFLLSFSSSPSVFPIYTINKTYKLDLSNNAILCMFQDNRGYMWLGTYDGLNLYNSKSTFVYRFEMDDNSTLSSNIVHKIAQADADHLWVSTFLGLDKFSLKERKVTESYDECPEAKLLDVDSKGNTWVLTKRNYISYYTPISKKFIDIHFPGASPESVLDLFVDKESKVNLILRNGSIKQAQISKTSGKNIFSLEINDLIFHTKTVTSAVRANGQLYYIDKDMDVYLYDKASNTSKCLTNLSSYISADNLITSLIVFNNDIYITLKNAGILKLKAQEQYKVEKINSEISIFCATKDKQQDLLWIGTDGQGVKLYYQNHDIFKSLPSDNLSLPSLKPIRSIFTDKSNSLWIGTKGDGLIRVTNYNDHNKRNATKYTTEQGLSNNNVFSFAQSLFHNIVWIGTEGPGLSFYSYADEKIKTITNVQIGKVHQICEINATTLWLATAGNGLLEVKIKEEKGELSIVSVDEFILKKNGRTCDEFHAMIYDGKSTLFVGSRGGYGIAKFDILTKEYEFIPMSKSNSSAIGDILSLHYSQDSIFYIGASSGLTKMQFRENGHVSIKQYDKKSGIANDMIHGILEDNKGFIWLSTNKGLTKFNPQNDFFHNYSYPELSVTEFSDDAYWKDATNSRLFFGGVNGLVWIDLNHDLPTPTYQTELKLFDLTIAGKNSSWEKYMDKEGHLIVPADANNFTISFVALDYINGDNYEYSYILENYNSTWTELQKKNEVTFTNLPYGDYTLRLRCKSDVINTYNDDLILHITKLAPWYLTSWAIAGYLLLFVVCCIYVAYQLDKKIAERQSLITKKIEENAKQNLLEAKLEFFTNITHELCTPLTVINGITEQFAKTNIEASNLKEYSNVLKHNVDNLNELIREILDFRQVGESKLKADNIQPVNIFRLIQHHLESFQAIAKENKIDLETNIKEDLIWNTDTTCFNRIFLNLISNAFKYNKKEEGVIKVSAFIERENLILKVYNTGRGIAESEMSYIFDHFRIIEEDTESNNNYLQMSTRNGIGLYLCKKMATLLGGKIAVSSKLNKYAEFIVTLPSLQLAKDFFIESADNIKDSSDFPKTKLNNREVTAKETILVVDDNYDIIWYLKELLREEYNILAVYSAEEALKSIEEQSPTLIITDIMMPSIDGLELIGSIKRNKFTKHIPLIILSAKISEKEQAEGLDIGADAYLTKPFSPVVLLSTIKRLIETKDNLKDYYYSPESAYEYSEGQLIHQTDKDFIAEISTIIDANIENEKFGPEFIAEKLGMSTRNLYRRFKKVTDLAPSDFIKDYRFTLAAKLLITTDLTILEVIYKVGITNKSYFYREFMKRYNTTPKDYRLNR